VAAASALLTFWGENVSREPLKGTCMQILTGSFQATAEGAMKRAATPKTVVNFMMNDGLTKGQIENEWMLSSNVKKRSEGVEKNGGAQHCWRKKYQGRGSLSWLYTPLVSSLRAKMMDPAVKYSRNTMCPVLGDEGGPRRVDLQVASLILQDAIRLPWTKSRAWADHRGNQKTALSL
jgi:hypothetical protein